MVVLTSCNSCHKEEGLNIVGAMADSLSSQELTDLIKNCIFRCDPCFMERVTLLEEVAEEKAKASKPEGLNIKKPKILVKRGG